MWCRDVVYSRRVMDLLDLTCEYKITSYGGKNANLITSYGNGRVLWGRGS